MATFKMLTATGGQVDPVLPASEDIRIEDIAHSLARICRYNGHTTYHYSVAQHCVLLSQHVPFLLQHYALMHDAAEAYVGDLSRPLRSRLPEFTNFEVQVELQLEARFSYKNMMPELQTYDLAICRDEILQLFPIAEAGQYLAEHGQFLPAPLGIAIDPWPAEAAKAMFLARFEELFDGE